MRKAKTRWLDVHIMINTSMKICKFHDSLMGNQCKTCAVCKAMIFNTEGDMSTSFVHLLDEDYNVTNKGTRPFNVYGRPV